MSTLKVLRLFCGLYVYGQLAVCEGVGPVVQTVCGGVCPVVQAVCGGVCPVV